jgi:glycosyltransferase involved in cell wall biosynthesis
MRVNIYTLNYVPSTGGLVSYAKNVSAYLAREGHDVFIYCALERAGVEPREELIDGVRVIRLDILSILKPLRLWSPFIIFYNLCRELKCRRDDILRADLHVARHFYFMAALCALGYSRRIVYLAPLVATRLLVVGTRVGSLLDRLKNFFLIPQVALIEYYGTRKARRIAVLSKSKKAEFQSYIGDRVPIAVIPIGIDTAKFSPKLPVNNASSVLRVLCVCRLTPEKNVHTLIDAIAIFRECYPDRPIELTIVGDGPLRSNLELQAVTLRLGSAIKFIGEVADASSYYRSCDVMVMISTYEGFGQVYIEANACGAPCIGLSTYAQGAITACDEIIFEGVNGHLLRENSPEMLVHVLAENYEAYVNGALHSNCIAHVEKHYSWAVHIERLRHISSMP